MKLSDYLAPERVVPDVRDDEVSAVLSQLLTPCRRSAEVDVPEDLLEALLARESVLSTGIGRGIAVPHAVADSVPEAQVILGIAPEGVDFRSLDGRPVRVFFVLLSPPDRASHHTRLLARIARLCRDPTFVTKLAESRDPESALAVIDEYERTHG